MTSPDQRNTTVYLGADVSGYSRGMQQADQQTRGFIATIDTLVHKMGQIPNHIGDKLQGAGKKGFLGLTGAIADAATFQKQLSQLAGQSAVTGRSLALVKGGIEDTFRNLPVSRTEVLQLTQALSELGVHGAGNLQRLTTTYLKLGAVSGANPVALGASFQQLNQLMGGASSEQISKYANSLLTVSANAGVSAQGVSDFANNLAPIAHLAGVATPAVIGISTAFNKAGQDGRVAANTFNSILYDIAHNVQTGSPQIAQYANLIGVTTEQFKKMSGTTQIIDVLNKLGGPQGALTLERWGYEGIRNQQAIAAVTQSGDLSTYVNQAFAASGDTKNLDKGASASWNNMVDQSVRVRNALTDVGESIGGVFLTPLTKATEGIANMAHWADNLVRMLGPLAGIFTAAGSAAGVVAGSLLHIAGLVALPVLGRFLMRSTGVASFSAGRYLARGDDPKEGTAAYRATQAYNNGTMTGWQTRLMNRGVQFEQYMANRVPGQGIGAGQMLKMGALAPIRTAGYIWRDTANFTRVAMQNDFQRQGLQWGAGGGARAVFQNLRNEAAKPFLSTLGANAGSAGLSWYRNIQTSLTAGRQLAGSGVRGLYRGFTRAVAGQGPMEAFATKYDAKMAEPARMTRTYERMFDKLNGNTISLSDRFRQLGDGTASLAAGMRGAAGAVGRQGLGLGMGALGGVARLGAGIGGLMMSPLGMIGLSAGMMLYQSSANSARQEQERAQMTPQDLDPLKDYNSQLGITTSSMNTFTGSVDSASQQLKNLLGTITKESSTSDVASAIAHGGSAQASQASDDKNIQAIFRSTAQGKNPDAVAALGQTMAGYNMTDPQQVMLVGQSAIKAGFTPDQVAAAIRTLPADLTPKARRGRAAGVIADTRALGENLQSAQLGQSSHFGLGVESVDPEGKSQNLAAQHIDAVRGQIGQNATLYNQKYANLYGGASLLSFLSTSASHVRNDATEHGLGNPDANDARQNLLSIDIKRAFATKKSASAIADHIAGMDFGSMTNTEREKALYGVARWAGSSDLKQFFGNAKTVDPAKFSSRLVAASLLPTDDAEIANVRKLGWFGRQVTRENGSIQQGLAAGAEGDPQKYYTALGDMAKFANQAAAASGKQGSASVTAAEELGRLQQQATASTDQLYQMAEAAKAIVSSQRGVEASHTTRAGAYAMAGQDWNAAVRLAQSPKATAAQRASVLPNGEDWKTIQSATETQRQFLIAQMQQVKDFDKQQYRAKVDFHHQTLLEEYNFNLQLNQMDYDFGLQQQRQREDFTRTMARQAEDAAKSIYDPFSRVQPVAIDDTRSVLDNLGDQNQRLAQQRANLEKLRREGVSQQSIDTLQLNDPRNAQQLQRMVEDITNDPSLVAKMNHEIAQRLGATTALVQSTFSDTYRHTVEDFRRQTDRAVTDEARQRQRMVDANTRSMDEQARQFSLSTARAQKDMADSLVEITGTMGEVINQSLTLLGNQGHKYLGKAADSFIAAVERIRTAYLASIGILNPDSGASPGTGPQGKGGTKQGPSSADVGTGGASPAPRAPRAPSNTHDTVNTPAPPQPRNVHDTLNDIPPAPATGGGYTVSPGAQHLSGLGPIDEALYGWVMSGVKTYGALHHRGFSKNNMSHYNNTIQHEDWDLARIAAATISGIPQHYMGGIFTTPHIGSFAERGPEMGIPLNGRGQAFLADMYVAISRQLVSQLAATVPVRGTATEAGGGTVHYDYRTEISGDITVVAPDTRKFMAELESKKRLDRLAQPASRAARG